MTPRYPHVRVHLCGQDGVDFLIIGRTITALKKAKVAQSEIDAFRHEAESSKHLLETVMAWVDLV